MKLGLFKLSLGVSLTFHAIVFGVVKWAGTNHRPAALQQEREVMTLHLVAAPLTPAEAVVAAAVSPPAGKALDPVSAVPPPPVAEPPPPAVEQPEVTPVLPKPIETPEPMPPVPPTPVVAPRPRVEAQSSVPTPTASTRGDGSSIQPGEDAITSKVTPGVLAHPNYLKNPEPVYPVQARRRHQQGAVLLEVKVSARGRTLAVSVKESSGHAILDEAALKAVRDWEFEPARVGVTAVESRIEVPVRFQLAK